MKFLCVNQMLVSLSTQVLFSLKVGETMKRIGRVRWVPSNHLDLSSKGTRLRSEKACATRKQSNYSKN